MKLLYIFGIFAHTIIRYLKIRFCVCLIEVMSNKGKKSGGKT